MSPERPTETSTDPRGKLRAFSAALGLEGLTHFVAKNISMMLGSAAPSVGVSAGSMILRAESGHVGLLVVPGFAPSAADYVISDKAKRELFLLQRMHQGDPGWNAWEGHPTDLGTPWISLTLPSNQALGAVTLAMGPPDAKSRQYRLVDAGSNPLLRLEVLRGLVKNDTLEVAYEGSVPEFFCSSAGITENLKLQDSTGNVVAKVTTHQLALKDTYEVVLEGRVDPLIPILSAHLFRR